MPPVLVGAPRILFRMALTSNRCSSAPDQAYKGKGEEYRLFWSERPEFVRMAARYGATIVPFAGVGAEDGFQMLLDPNEVRRLPVVGAMLEERARAQIPQARRCALSCTRAVMSSMLSSRCSYARKWTCLGLQHAFLAQRQAAGTQVCQGFLVAAPLWVPGGPEEAAGTRWQDLGPMSCGVYWIGAPWCKLGLAGVLCAASIAADGD